MPSLAPVNSRTSRQETSSPMLPIDQHVHVRYHIDSLLHAAEVERTAARQRRLHRDEHAIHPGIGHTHAAGGLRRAVGHALIVLGSAIAGSAETGVRRAA